MQSNDQELIDLLARCQMKDQRAIKVLYDRLAPHLNGVAYRIVQSDELSNEVLQEAFVQIWQNAGSYEFKRSKPLTWITSIVRYRAIDKLQQEQRHRHLAVLDEVDSDNRQQDGVHDAADMSAAGQLATGETDAGEMAPVAPSLTTTDTPDGEYARWQLRRQVQQCLEPMNDKVRQCIELAYLMGYSREELAQRFDTRVNTVKSWLHRGSERLKQCLQSKNQTDLI